jgi:hypothetical protein
VFHKQSEYQVLPDVFEADALGKKESGSSVSYLAGWKMIYMDNWYSLNLGDGMTSGMTSSEIEEEFSRAFPTERRPPDAAVFTRPESEGHLHCEVIAYFSPAARDLAKAFEAELCERPRRAGLALLAGEDASWSLLFPEKDR